MWRSIAGLVLAVLVLGASILEGHAALRSEPGQLGPSPCASPAAAVHERVHSLQFVPAAGPVRTRAFE
jgi:hypothetical protein